MLLSQIKPTRTVMTVRDMVAHYQHDQLDLRPPFQRLNVWKPVAKSFLIDSIIRGLPIPVVILRESPGISLSPKREVVDGQQRLTSILAFILPDAFPEPYRFRISKLHALELADCDFESLAPDYKLAILDYEVSVHILPSSVEDAEVLRIFSRINTSGTPLKQQELRNAQFSGYFKQISSELSVNNFNYWNTWRVFSPGDFARMRDIEFTAELMGYMLDGLKAGSASYIDRLYEQYDDGFEQGDVVFDRFVHVMNTISAGIGEAMPSSEFAKITWFYTLFGVVYDYLYDSERLDNGWVEGRVPKRMPRRFWEHALAVSDRVAARDSLPDELARAIVGRTTHRSSREIRADFLKEGL